MNQSRTRSPARSTERGQIDRNAGLDGLTRLCHRSSNKRLNRLLAPLFAQRTCTGSRVIGCETRELRSTDGRTQRRAATFSCDTPQAFDDSFFRPERIHRAQRVGRTRALPRGRRSVEGILETDHHEVWRHRRGFSRRQRHGDVWLSSLEQYDGRRTVEAALELHAAIRDLPREGPATSLPRLKLHTGIHCGLVLLIENDGAAGQFSELARCRTSRHGCPTLRATTRFW